MQWKLLGVVYFWAAWKSFLRSFFDAYLLWSVIRFFFFGRLSRFSWKSLWQSRNSCVFTLQVKVLSDLATEFYLVAFIFENFRGMLGYSVSIVPLDSASSHLIICLSYRRVSSSFFSDSFLYCSVNAELNLFIWDLVWSANPVLIVDQQFSYLYY